MGLITITSDWGHNDYYLAAVKAKIYSYYPDAKILDVTHHLPLYDIGKASYFLQNIYPHTLPGTVHIIGVNSIAHAKAAHLIVCYDGQYFIGADNGIFSLLFPEIPAEVYEITEMQDSENFVFPERDLFAKVAAKLAFGESPSQLGVAAKIENKLMRSLPVFRYETNEDGEEIGAEIYGSVVYIDRYENVHTNIDKELFTQFQSKFSRFEISCLDVITKISSAYSDVEEGDALALFSTDGYLQIALNQTKASSLLGLDYRSQIIVKFKK